MKLTPFGASVLGVILLLSIGFLGPAYITGNIIDVEQAIQQAQQKTQKEMQQAQQTLQPTAQPLYITALQQAQHKIDQNAPQWAQKATPTICKLVPQATSTESFVNQLMPQLERSMQPAVQQIITIVLKQNIIIQQGDPEAQQKISQAQTISNAAIKPLTTYGAQQILITAIKQCPKEQLPPSAADTIPQTQRIAPALSTQPTRTEQAGTVSTAFESQPQIGEGPISGGGIGQGPQQGLDVGLKDVLFYYEDAMSMWVDKDKLEPRARLSPSVMTKNFGTAEAKNVEISVSVDGGTEDKKIIQTLPAGGASGYGFFLPAGLSGGKHELTIRFTAKDDVNPTNDVVKVPFTILVDGALKDLKFSYVNEQRSVLPKTVDTNSVDTSLQLVATLYVSQEGRTPIQKADIIMTVDNGPEQKQTIYGNQRYISFDVNKLQPGSHELMFRLEIQGDTNPNNNVVKTTITAPTPTAQQPTPPVVEQPKPQPTQQPVVQQPTTPPVVEQPKPETKEDIAFEKVVLLQGTAEYAFGPQGDIVDEQYNTVLKLYTTSPSNVEFKVFIDEQQKSLPGVSHVFIPKIYSMADIGRIPAGKHKLKIVLDPYKEVLETNEDNNVFETEFWVKAALVKETLKPVTLPATEPTGDLIITPAGDKWLSDFDTSVAILPTQIKTNQRFSGEVTIRNNGNKASAPTFIVKIDDAEIHRQTLWSIEPQKDYTTSFGSSNRKFWPGKHKITLIAQADKDQNPSDNTFETEITVIDAQTGSTTPPTPTKDIRIDKVALAQYFSVLQDYLDRDLGPEGKLIDERYDIRIRMYSQKENLPSLSDVFIDGKPAQIKGVTSAQYPAPHSVADIAPLPPGKHHLKIVLDPYNSIYEGQSGEANNIFETDFWVKEQPKDISLQQGSFAQFDDAKAKQTGKNTLQLGIGYDLSGNTPKSFPMTIKLPDKTETKNIDVKVYDSGITAKTGVYYQEIPVDRNKFPTHVYVSIDFPEDADKTNNAIIIPVIVLKDRKVYKIT